HAAYELELEPIDNIGCHGGCLPFFGTPEPGATQRSHAVLGGENADCACAHERITAEHSGQPEFSPGETLIAAPSCMARSALIQPLPLARHRQFPTFQRSV